MRHEKGEAVRLWGYSQGMWTNSKRMTICGAGWWTVYAEPQRCSRLRSTLMPRGKWSNECDKTWLRLKCCMRKHLAWSRETSLSWTTPQRLSGLPQQTTNDYIFIWGPRGQESMCNIDIKRISTRKLATFFGWGPTDWRIYGSYENQGSSLAIYHRCQPSNTSRQNNNKTAKVWSPKRSSKACSNVSRLGFHMPSSANVTF